MIKGGNIVFNIGCLIHVVAFLTSLVGLGYSIFYISEHGEGLLYYRGWPGKLKYLTFWNMLAQPTYYFICILVDLSILTGKSNRKPRLQDVRDNFHATFAFPMGIFVVSTFWTIYAINRELVFPKSLDKVTPQWQNQVVHTSPIVFLLLEKLFVNIQYPSKTRGIMTTVGVGLLYQIWLFWIAHSQGIWVYPVLRVLSTPWRTLFLASLWLCLVITYFLGQWTTNIVWNNKAFGKLVKKKQK